MVFPLQSAQPAGSLIACPDAPWNGKVFWVNGNERRWMPSVEHLACYGLSLDQTRRATAAEVEAYHYRGQAPKVWAAQDFHAPQTNKSVELREICVSQLKGSGIEFGPGANPMPIPLTCEAHFADFVSSDEVRKRKYEAAGDDFAPVEFVMDLSNPCIVPDASLDFIICAHVIEHVPDPLRVYERAYGKLKAGGQLVLVVPDAARSFDLGRPLTSLEHLIADFESPDEHRDREHYEEFFSHVLSGPQREEWQRYYARAFGIEEPNLSEFVERAIALRADLHLHTWTYPSFGELVQFARQLSPWKTVWSHPGGSELPEFYYVLSK
jgi:SAM-dependent methyltransferase